MRLSYRQRVLVMVALLALFMAGTAIANTVNELLGLAIGALALGLAALVVVGLNRSR